MATRHKLFSAVLALLLACVAPACVASQHTLTNGGFRFEVPDGWPRILQTSGDPEMQVFEDPDSTAASKNALARVTVSSQSVPDIASFRALVATESSRAETLPDYHLDTTRSGPTDFHYTATDGSVKLDYAVHFYLHDDYAVEVRCVRPVKGAATEAWAQRFDRGCRTVTNSLR